MTRLVSLCFATTALMLLMLSGCTPSQSGCNSDVDCPGLQCHLATGICVECLDSADCADGDAFCCQGTCQPAADIESSCGCVADPQGLEGESCGDDTPICQAQGERVGLLNVDQGVCGCPCTPGEGGTLCAIDEEAEAGFTCGCDRADLTTCEAPSFDENGNPHLVADTCNPNPEPCACFADGDACSGVNSDCTAAGCVNLTTDVVNCGVPTQDCTSPDTGIGVDGTCQNGGCACDAATDCQGDGLNVDECAFVGNDQFCVCDDYEVAGEKSPCPMGLACVTGGCDLNGTAHATEDDLLAALGVESPQSTE
jgi:hypothetical protein